MAREITRHTLGSPTNPHNVRSIVQAVAETKIHVEALRQYASDEGPQYVAVPRHVWQQLFLNAYLVHGIEYVGTLYTLYVWGLPAIIDPRTEADFELVVATR